MKNYILKYNVHNYETFPVGTIVKKVKEEFACFEVVEGKMKGKKGNIADGLKGWVCDDTPKNRKLLEECMNKEKELRKQIEINSERIHNIPESEGL